MESKEFKVALFMLPLLTQGGGAEKYFIELARNLRERGVEADIVTMDENFFRKFARLLHIFARGNFFGKINTQGREKEEEIRKQLGEARWLKTSYKNLDKKLREYDIIYTKNELVELLLLKGKGCKNLPPIIVGVHTPLFYPVTNSFISRLHNFLYLSFFYRWLLGGIKCLHVSNRFTESLASEKLGARSQFIYYPFSVEKIQALAQKNEAKINFDENKKNIVFAGRLSEQKGFDILARIIEKIGKKPDLAAKISLNVFGSGDAKKERKMKKMSQEFSFLRYFGHVENKFMPYIFSRQDLMIFPSRWETLPFSLLEAQALGVPVVAFDIPGPQDIIRDGKTGRLVKNEEDFWIAVAEIIEDKIQFEKQEIIKNIKEKFNPDKVYEKMIEMFSQFLCKTQKN
jgi:glycosyltransferase involved in cell wall biosynthesis